MTALEISKLQVNRLWQEKWDELVDKLYEIQLTCTGTLKTEKE